MLYYFHIISNWENAAAAVLHFNGRRRRGTLTTYLAKPREQMHMELKKKPRYQKLFLFGLQFIICFTFFIKFVNFLLFRLFSSVFYSKFSNKILSTFLASIGCFSRCNLTYINKMFFFFRYQKWQMKQWFG